MSSPSPQNAAFTTIDIQPDGHQFTQAGCPGACTLAVPGDIPFVDGDWLSGQSVVVVECPTAKTKKLMLEQQFVRKVKVGSRVFFVANTKMQRAVCSQINITDGSVSKTAIIEWLLELGVPVTIIEQLKPSAKSFGLGCEVIREHNRRLTAGPSVSVEVKASGSSSTTVEVKRTSSLAGSPPVTDFIPTHMFPVFLEMLIERVQSLEKLRVISDFSDAKQSLSKQLSFLLGIVAYQLRPTSGDEDEVQHYWSLCTRRFASFTSKGVQKYKDNVAESLDEVCSDLKQRISRVNAEQKQLNAHIISQAQQHSL